MKRFLYITRNVGHFAIKIGPWCLIVWKHRGPTIGRWEEEIHLHRKLRLRKR